MVSWKLNPIPPLTPHQNVRCLYHFNEAWGQNNWISVREHCLIRRAICRNNDDKWNSVETQQHINAPISLHTSTFQNWISLGVRLSTLISVSSSILQTLNKRTIHYPLSKFKNITVLKLWNPMRPKRGWLKTSVKIVFRSREQVNKLRQFYAILEHGYVVSNISMGGDPSDQVVASQRCEPSATSNRCLH